MDFRRAVAKVQRAASGAAREVVEDPLVVRQVEEAVVQKFEDALLKNKVISDPSAWGFKVGRHEALRLAKRPEAKLLHAGFPDLPGRPKAPHPPDVPAVRAALAARRTTLTHKQWEAVHVVLKHGTFSAAARALRKDRRGVSRLFQRALHLLQLTRK